VEGGAHYDARNAAFAAAVTAAGLPTAAGDGLNLWLPLPVRARPVAEQLMRRGWLARTGDEFVLADDAATRHLRLTVHDLAADESARLVDDLASAVRTVAERKMG
jgi:DNA-binding transcriptional MocR family regulator